MPLYAAVHVARPIQFTAPNGKPGGLWSPISSTLIHTPKHAVLVDTPITIAQTETLIAWIKDTLHPGCKLKYIYITHGHGDHWFGINQLLKAFPGSKALATQATLEHMKSQCSPKVFNAMWASRFPKQIDVDFSLAEPLPASGKFYLPAEDNSTEQGYTFQAVEVGHTDSPDTTVLFVPHLKLVVAGDVVYGDVHQMLAEANTRALRMEWVRALETVMSLDPKPEVVVPGHMKPDEMCGSWHLERSRQYVLDFDRIVESGEVKNVRDLVARMKELWPTRFNDAALIFGAVNALKVKEKEAQQKGQRL